MVNIENEITKLTTQQVRALASQYKLADWRTADIGTLRRKLIVLAETTSILEGQRTYESTNLDFWRFRDGEQTKD